MAGPRPRQLVLVLPTWGGKRRGAGRKPTRPGRAPHAPRARLASRFPVHVTLKLEDWLPSLRDSELLPAVEGALGDGKERDGFRLVHYSIQDHHLHLLVEASKQEALARGIQGLSIRLARRINRTLARGGRVFVDRYFARILRTPREVKHCLSYVLNNRRRHAAQCGDRLARGWIDDRSSGRFFDGWRDAPPRPPSGEEPRVAAPRTWLLSKGWRRWGLLRVDEVPGPEPD
jgi:putative transposase